MSRKCKPGQRARIIDGPNCGKVVLVVRHFHEKLFEGAEWPHAMFPWVATSLGDPLRVFSGTGVEMPSERNIVICDRALQPLKDDDDGLDRSTEVEKPRARPKPSSMPVAEADEARAS